MRDPHAMVNLILALHEEVRDEIVAATERQGLDRMASIDRDDEGDTIYAIDVVGEAIVTRLAEALAHDRTFVMVAEGLPGGRRVYPPGADEASADCCIIVDPIDGTRGLMYQKRSAWVLTGVAPNRGAATRLSDVVLAVQTEIPFLKQHLSDQLWAFAGKGMQARRWNRMTRSAEPLTLRRSGSATIAHGFATIVRFFPGAREVLGAIDDEVVHALVTPEPGRATSFEDQYASTAGQLYELLAGHDRFIADLRPLVKSQSLCCHPYDVCTALIAREAGVILTDPRGAALDAPFDLTTDVAWVGYANESLRRAIEPVLQGALRRRGFLK